MEYPLGRAKAGFIKRSSSACIPDGEVEYFTIGHTNELVTLSVSGPAWKHFLGFEGLWYPGPIIDNTQVHAAVRKALGF